MTISLLLWTNVYSNRLNKPVQRTESIKITAVNLDEKKLAITDIPSEISITLAGSSDQMRMVTQQNLAAIVDLSGNTPGEKSYPVFIYPSAAREMLVNSAISVKIKLEQLQTKRMDIEVYAAPSSLTPISNVVVTPRNAFVTGPESVVSSIRSVRVFASNDTDVYSADGAELSARAFDEKQLTVRNVLMSSLEEIPPFNEQTATGEFRVRVQIRPELPTTIPPKTAPEDKVKAAPPTANIKAANTKSAAPKQ